MRQTARFQITNLPLTPADLKQELREGFAASQKYLPSKYFYDEAGSALFEQICDLPEYYPTRTESSILQSQSANIIEQCPFNLTLVELGSGSATKTRHLIAACLEAQDKLIYYPIDVSPAALEMAAEGLLPDFTNLHIHGLAGEYEAGLEYLEQHPDEPHLVIFLGSTIGNFDEEQVDEFFTMLRHHLRPIDRFLLGFDLLKDTAVLVPAYNDAQGVTVQFNLNLLVRLNREFGADFDLSAFAHNAIFNAQRSRMEMYLVSRTAQRVRIPGLDLELSFTKGETIFTENSYKHSKKAMTALLKGHGFDIEAEFTDAKRYFCLMLMK